MTFDPTRPVQTRDGRKAEILRTDISGDYSILAVVIQDDGRIEAQRFLSDGRASQLQETLSDLINIQTKVSRFTEIQKMLKIPTYSLRDALNAVLEELERRDQEGK